MTFPKAIATCLLFLLSLLSSGAQESGSLKLRVLVFGGIAGPSELTMQENGGERKTDIELHLNNFTGPYSTPSRSLSFVSTEGDEEKQVGRVTVPSSLGKEVLLIFLPDRKKEGTYHVMPVSDAAAKFKPGDRKFVNLSAFPIAGMIDGRKFSIKPGGVTGLTSKAPPGGRDNHEVAFYFKDGETVKPLTSTVWPHDPGVRSLVFFWTHPKTGRIRIQSIAEEPKVEEEP